MRLTHRCILIALLAATTACTPVQLRRAIVDVPDVEHAITMAKELDARGEEAPPAGSKWFEVERGSHRVIVTAPHSTKPFRDGKYRFADGGATAGLAIAIHEICDVTVQYVTYASPSDPNFYDDNDFKLTLAELITTTRPVLILDIHASHPQRPYDVDIGTMDGKSFLADKRLVPDLARHFTAQGVQGVSVNWFAASKNQTITKFGAAHGIPTVQLEFSATRMSPGNGDFSDHRFAQSVEAIAAFLTSRKLCTRAPAK